MRRRRGWPGSHEGSKHPKVEGLSKQQSQDVRDVARSSSATEQFGTLLFRLGAAEKLPSDLKAELFLVALSLPLPALSFGPVLLAWAKDVRDRRASPALRPSSSHLLLCPLLLGWARSTPWPLPVTARPSPRAPRPGGERLHSFYYAHTRLSHSVTLSPLERMALCECTFLTRRHRKPAEIRVYLCRICEDPQKN